MLAMTHTKQDLRAIRFATKGMALEYSDFIKKDDNEYCDIRDTLERSGRLLSMNDEQRSSHLVRQSKECLGEIKTLCLLAMNHNE